MGFGSDFYLLYRCFEFVEVTFLFGLGMGVLVGRFWVVPFIGVFMELIAVRLG